MLGAAALLAAPLLRAPEMIADDASRCGPAYRHDSERKAYRWGTTMGELGYHGGKVKVARPRIHDVAGNEVQQPSWGMARGGDLLRDWALNLMLLSVSTRKYGRAVRLPAGHLGRRAGDGASKSSVSRHFVALSRKKLWEWLSSDLSGLDLLVIQIDGLCAGNYVLVLVKQRSEGADKSGGRANP